MTNFLTVKAAALLVGKSPSSIRRIIHPIIKDDAHADRTHVKPSVEEVMQLRVKGETFGWQLSEELLRREVPLDGDPEKGSRDSYRPSSGDEHSELIAMLRRELDIKNQQINQQNDLLSKQVELVSGLSERVHESNLLIGSLQQRLTIADGRSDKPETIVDAQQVATSKTTKPEKGSAASTKAPKPKPGFFSRMFR